MRLNKAQALAFVSHALLVTDSTDTALIHYASMAGYELRETTLYFVLAQLESGGHIRGVPDGVTRLYMPVNRVALTALANDLQNN